MGWWNIDILYQMFKNGVVYHRAPDHGPHGSGYPPGTNKGLTQDQSHIQYKEKAKAKAAQGPPSKDAFALPRREPRKIPKVTPVPAREPIESKHPAGDAGSAAVAIEEFSNAARAVDSESYGEAARALIRLASMNIPLKVLFQLGDCPKHVKRWAKSGSTGEIRAAANMCVETWRGVVQTIPEEERKAARKEAQNARETPEPEPEPVHHDSRATFVSGSTRSRGER